LLNNFNAFLITNMWQVYTRPTSLLGFFDILCRYPLRKLKMLMVSEHKYGLFYEYFQNSLKNHKTVSFDIYEFKKLLKS
jgi:hypothetical protein